MGNLKSIILPENNVSIINNNKCLKFEELIHLCLTKKPIFLNKNKRFKFFVGSKEHWKDNILVYDYKVQEFFEFKKSNKATYSFTNFNSEDISNVWYVLSDEISNKLIDYFIDVLNY